MKPRTLSASSAQVYELCPARFRAERIDYAPSIQNSAANLGTVVHTALERWVLDKHYENGATLDVLHDLYEVAYYQEFADASLLNDGRDMLKTWFDRQDWAGRTVLEAEKKNHFMLPVPGGQVKFNYLFDRLDQHDDGDIEVVDYKTSGFPVTFDDLRAKIQPRCYALAAQIAYPEAPNVWVTFDMLRFDPVGVKFTKEQNADTFRYLKRLAERIWNDDGTKETLNDECRFCVRRHECRALRKHVNAGGPLTLNDPHEAADRRAELYAAKGAIEKLLRDVDDYLLDYCEREDIFEFESDQTIVSVGIGGRRQVNAEEAAKIIGPDLLARHGSLTVTSIDAMLKGDELTADQKSDLKRTMARVSGEPKIKTKPKKGDD